MSDGLGTGKKRAVPCYDVLTKSQGELVQHWVSNGAGIKGSYPVAEKVSGLRKEKSWALGNL